VVCDDKNFYPNSKSKIVLGAFCNNNYALDATAYVSNAVNLDNTWQYYVKFPLSNLAPVSAGKRAVVRLFGYYEGVTLTVAANAVNDNR